MSTQMKKRLRAEVYASYIKMGQAGYRVDPQVYEIVRARRADATEQLIAADSLATPRRRLHLFCSSRRSQGELLNLYFLSTTRQWRT